MALKIFEGELPEKTWGRILVHGPTGAGKSTLGSTMPGPRAVLAVDDNAHLPLERGYDELPRVIKLDGEVSRTPELFVQVQNEDADSTRIWDEIMEGLAYLESEIPKRGIQSIVIDSLTQIFDFCARIVLAQRAAAFEANQKRANSKRIRKLEALDQQGWGVLRARIEDFRHRVHAIPAHVLWLAGSRPPRTKTADNGTVIVTDLGGPDLAGGTAARFPYQVGAMLYLERFLDSSGEEDIVRLRTCSDGSYAAKDNVGRLDSIEPADMMVVLARMGYLGDEITETVLAQAPVRTEAERQNERAGVLD